MHQSERMKIAKQQSEQEPNMSRLKRVEQGREQSGTTFGQRLTRHRHVKSFCPS